MNKWFYKICANLHKIFGLSTCDIYKFTFFNSEDTHVVIKHILLENVLFDYMKMYYFNTVRSFSIVSKIKK